MSTPTFRPAWWLRGPHGQTIWGSVTRTRRRVRLRRETLITPDDDDLVLDHLDVPDAREGFRFVLLHGLEGSTYSVYMQGLLSSIAELGFSATAVNFRSCARDPIRIFRSLPNRRPRFYHSGETSDFDLVVRTLRTRDPETQLLGCGISLGGNVLLKWLGEHPGANGVAAAATLSVPYDLGAGAEYMTGGGGPFYVGRFLKSLRGKAADVVRRFPEVAGLVDLNAVRTARTFREFDDAVTGPLHGFTGADDYYTRSSSIHFLHRITVPTLCISAEDDPFLPPAVLALARSVASPSVECLVTPVGGPTGVVGGRLPWRSEYWAEEVMSQWLASQADRIEKR
ncbi:MAG: alpha/beta fold hydrolase [Thermoanaerobaculia bacterium]